MRLFLGVLDEFFKIINMDRFVFSVSSQDGVGSMKYQEQSPGKAAGHLQAHYG